MATDDAMARLFTAEERAFADEVRGFVDARLPADIRDRLLAGERETRDDVVTWTRILHARGWSAYRWPVEYGGPGFTPVQCYLFDDICASMGAPELVPFGHRMVAPVIMRYGTDDQKAKFLPPIASCEHWWAQGYSEPGAGSDLASLRTRARRDGDHYVVDGQKTWTTSAHLADWIFCLVRTAEGPRKQDGISFLLVDLRSPGIEIRPIITFDGHHEINEVWFDAVRVPVENRVGPEGGGWECAKYLLEHERLNFGGMGFCKREIALLRRLAAGGRRGGRPVLDDPAIAARLASLEARLATIDLMNLRVFRRLAAGVRDELDAPFLKIASSHLQQDIAELQTRILGVAALRPDGVAATYCNLRKTTIYAGSNEIQRNIAARRLLG
jgi:alkylation response protein AidB-like acyl-CoA dehydrogenase